jgi:pilus assembly protein CpaE
MRAGTREVLSLPLNPERLAQAIRRVAEILERKPLSFKSTDEVFSFLPAKPGGGASTLALNVASALARRPGCRTLLADFDLNCGMISFLLKITAGHSIIDAVEASTNLEEMIWKNLVEKRDNLHVLPSGRLNPDNTIDPEAAIDVITFARRCYDAICIDLSGNMEPYSIELLRQSKKIFLVCAAEMPSLHLARAKTQFLRSIGLHERVSVLLNRADRSSAFSIQEVEEMLGAPVRFAFMNDPRRVSSALKEGTCVNRKSDLGHQFELFSTSVIAPTDGSKPATEARNKRRFVEYFSIVPAKYYTERNS